jgi:hypothetical protein
MKLRLQPQGHGWTQGVDWSNDDKRVTEGDDYNAVSEILLTLQSYSSVNLP